MIIFNCFRRVAFTIIMIMYDMIYDNLLPFQESRLSGGLWQCGSPRLPSLFRSGQRPDLNNLGSHRLPDCWSPPDRPSAGNYGPPLRGGPIQGRANQVDLNNLEASGFLDCSGRAVGPPTDVLRITDALYYLKTKLNPCLRLYNVPTDNGKAKDSATLALLLSWFWQTYCPVLSS